MRCGICGTMHYSGAYTSRGWLCYVCLDAFGYRYCVRCGAYFALDELRKWSGDLYCKSCIIPIARPEVRPRPPTHAPVAVKIAPPKREIGIEEELLPDVIGAKALEILRGKEKRQKGIINQLLMAIKKFLRGKETKFEIK